MSEITKEALEYLVSLKTNQTYMIDGATYSDNRLFKVEPNVYRPTRIEVAGLDSIVKLVSRELTCVANPIFIRVSNYRTVDVFSTLDDYMQRDSLYRAVCDAPDFRDGWMSHDEAIIKLRSAFVPNDGTEYLLDLLSRISKEDSVTSEDNGVSQTVSARSGISLKSVERLRSRIPLVPYRTFTEVEQPESEFILRMDDGGKIGLFEADGGKWKLDAKQSIMKYFEEQLRAEVQDGNVVVMV